MTGDDLIAAALGLVLVLAGGWLVVRNRRAGEGFASLDRDEQRYSLLNRERVERINASIDDPASRVLDRAQAIFLGVMLLIVGGAALVEAVA